MISYCSHTPIGDGDLLPPTIPTLKSFIDKIKTFFDNFKFDSGLS